MALGVIKGLVRTQRRVPGDVSAIGFDNISYTIAIMPELTTIAQPIAEMGRAIIQLLLRQIHDPASTPEMVVLQPTLIERESCRAVTSVERAPALYPRRRISERQACEELTLDTIHVVLAHDHPLVGAGMHILEEARHLFEDLAPDTLLIEMSLADAPDLMLAEPAAPAPAASRVFVLRGYQNRAFVFGLLGNELAAGLTEQDALQAIAESIQARSAGEAAGPSRRIVAKLPAHQLEGDAAATIDLTARESDVLRQLTAGKSDRDIGAHLGISETTVHYHLKNVYRKLGVRRRSEAIVWAIRSGWTE